MLIEKKSKRNKILSKAVYSRCLDYRYSLSKEWDLGLPRTLFILLNPSTATEEFNDPTISRCVARSRALGSGAMMVCNLFAFRGRKPSDLIYHSEPIGLKNDLFIFKACNWLKNGTDGSIVICGWGNMGSYLNRADSVKKELRKRLGHLYCLGVTNNKQPIHPLYVSYSKKIESFFF